MEKIDIHDLITKKINPLLNVFIENISSKYVTPPEKVIEGIYIYSSLKFQKKSWIWEFIDEKRNAIFAKFKEKLALDEIELIIQDLYFSLCRVLRKEDYSELNECFTKIIRNIVKAKCNLKFTITQSKIFKRILEIKTMNNENIINTQETIVNLKLLPGIYQIVTYKKFLFFKFSIKNEIIILLCDKEIKL